jgi:hypothetical protein
LSRPVIGLLRQSQVGGGSVDFTLALAMISGRGPTVMRCSSASPTILSQLGDLFGIVYDQQGSALGDVTTAS